ncbi:DUF951 domain-containing protein [Anaerosalibacter massiliensis]|uniref:DUF951 domain-containing protein n=1 Tax=Anaerosalibacter massiliensis TaxID=1347392 RepID=UPI0005B2818C|nr:DUF951 domain-containing protein [Anaerosalibacter massiliensis]
MIKKYNVGDIVSLKKQHPCGTNEWEVLRTGIDMKLKCLGCERQIWIPRIDFERRVRKIYKDGKWESINKS